MNRLLETLHSGAQGASNGAAGMITSPVDGIAAVLRKLGVDIPDDPVAGEKWMKKMGLIQEPKNRIAGLVGEGIGMAIPAIPVKIK